MNTCNTSMYYKHNYTTTITWIEIHVNQLQARLHNRIE